MWPNSRVPSLVLILYTFCNVKMKKWAKDESREPESNQRPKDNRVAYPDTLQSSALPAELSRGDSERKAGKIYI